MPLAHVNRIVSDQYDPVGSLQQLADNGQIAGYTANLPNQYTVAKVRLLGYDANGNLAFTTGGAVRKLDLHLPRAEPVVERASHGVMIATFALPRPQPLRRPRDPRREHLLHLGAGAW